MKFQVDVQCVSEDAGVPDVSLLQSWAQATLLQAYGRDAQLSIRVVDIEEGLDLNESYRRGEGATNVLAFVFEEGERLDPPLLGDVVICAPIVRSEAEEQGKSMDAHFAHMVVHGVLHLLGYDHQREKQAQMMESAEKDVLARLGFADPYVGGEGAGRTEPQSAAAGSAS